MSQHDEVTNTPARSELNLLLIQLFALGGGSTTALYWVIEHFYRGESLWKAIFCSIICFALVLTTRASYRNVVSQ